MAGSNHLGRIVAAELFYLFTLCSSRRLGCKLPQCPVQESQIKSVPVPNSCTVVADSG